VFSLLPTECLLIFDNYHELAAGSVLHEAFATAVAEVPSAANILVLSRTDPPHQFAAPVINQVVTQIDWAQLKLSVGEALAIAKARGIEDPTTVEELYRQTDGWLAGLTLMVERVKGGQSGTTAARAEAQETVFDYFGQVLLKRAAPEARAVMLRTGLLPYITASLAHAVSGNESALIHIDELYRRHLFISRIPGKHDTYQYHALFRAYLHSRAQAELSAEAISDIKLRGAVQLETDGDWQSAFAMYVEVEQWTKAEKILVEHASGLVGQGRWRTLQGCVKSLPEERIQSNAWVRYWLGRSQIQVDPALARVTLERTYKIFALTCDPTGQALCAAAVLEALYYGFWDFRSMDVWIERLAELLEGSVDFPSQQDELQAYSTLMLGAAKRHPDHGALGYWIGTITKMLSETADCNLIVTVASMLLALANTTVEEDTERIAVNFARPLLGNPQLTPRNAAFYLACEGYTHYMHGRYEESLELLEQADAIAEENGLKSVSLQCAVWRSLSARRAGMLDLAQRAIERVEDIRNQLVIASGTEGIVRSALVPLSFLKACLAFERGDHMSAMPLAHEAVTECLRGGEYNAAMLVRLVCANILAGCRRFDEAYALLTAVRNDVRGPVTAHYLAAVALNEAWIAHLQDDSARRDVLLKDALTRAADRRARERLRWYPNVLADLLPLAIERWIEADTALGLAREFRVTPAGCTTERWPWPAKVYTLGRFLLVIDGKPVEFSRKPPRKILLLLKAIIAFGGEAVPDQKLIDALWPDEEGDAARRALTITLHRLRGLSGHPQAVRQSGGTIGLDRRLCWVDALAFEGRLDGMNGGSQSSAGALDLYRGAFLAEDDVPWALATRERLRTKFTHAVGRTGEALEREGRYEKALELYRRGIEADNLIETFYQGLMRCYERLNRRTEALSTYRRLRDTLSVTLGVAPSTSTQRLFDAMRQG
jgi:DNA-binding SARP family transcriptional activator